MLIIFLLIAPSTCQFASYLSLRLRLPGRCREGDFDCGFGHCTPVRNFHDGRADCMDGSDEWCLFGQIRCGAYCVDFKESLGCMFHNKCDGSSKQPKFCEHTKEKLCKDPQSFPCKGYGECVLWHNLLDGQADCIDGSDEDTEYVRLLEGPFRCFFNRTAQPQPPMLIDYIHHPITTSPTFAPAQPPISCHRCPPPLPVFPPPLPVQPASLPSFPTLIPSDSSLPILPVSALSTLSPPVQIQHITPVLPTQPEPLFGDFFPENGTPLPYPTKIDFTVEAHIKTVLPPSATPTTGVPRSPLPPVASGPTTTAAPIGWTTDALAHIKVIPDSEKEVGPAGQATHIDLGTGEIIFGGETTPPTANASTGTPQVKTAETVVATTVTSTTAPSGPADGIFFPRPVNPITGRPAAIRPLPPYVMNTLRPIVPQEGGRVPVKIATPSYPGSPEHLIPIRPGIAIPTAYPDDHYSTPKYPFPEDYEGDFFGHTEPTVQIGVVTKPGTDSITTQPASKTSTTSPAISTEETSTSPSEASTSQSGSTSGASLKSSSTTVPPVTITTAEVDRTKNTSCPSSLLDPLRQKYPSPFCQCDSINNTGCHHYNRTIFQVKGEDVCRDDSSVSNQDKARVVLSTVKNGLPYSSCIDSNMDDGIIVSTNCPDCSLPLMQYNVDKNNPGPVHMKLEALNVSICSIRDLNNCHRNALCLPDSTGLRYHCVCKNGTKDLSDGKGLDCFGWPSDNDCFMIFRICLIFWLILLLGLLFCCPLLAFICYSLKKRSRRNVVVPVSTPTTKVKTAITPRSAQARTEMTPGQSAMASILVDALRSNARGISAVSHSMTTKDRVRFTDEVTYPPNTIDWKPIPESHSEPLQSIMKTPYGLPHSASDSKLPQGVGTRPTSPAVSVAGIPVAAAETPILEQIRTPRGSARGTPVERLSVHSLPIPPLEVPERGHKSSLDQSNLQSQSAPIVVKADVHQADQAHDDHSVVSVGVQPTIWETFRAVGPSGADRGREDSSSSLDDLIGTKFQDSRPVSRVEAEEKKIEIPVPKLDLLEEPPISPAIVPSTAEATVTEEVQKLESPKDVLPALVTPLVRKKSTQSLKLAEMLGVTLDDQNDMQALEELSSRNIDLPLEPVTLPSLGLTKLEQELLSLEPAERQRTPEQQAIETAVLKEMVEEEKRKEDLKRIMPPGYQITPKPVFVPTAARAKSRGGKRELLTVPSRRGDPSSSTEESDPEVSFARKMEALRRGGREANPFKDRKRRFRRPERQLSSISEKSAEIAAEAAITEQLSAGDFTVSVPNTTRSLSDWHAHVPKHRRFESSTTDTDSDIPSRFRRPPLISSPEIPDVSAARSRERLNLLHETSEKRKPSVKSVSSSKPKPATSVSKTVKPEPEKSKKKSFLPDVSRRSTANSRSSVDSKNRASVVSRKIATRKTEMRSSKSASDLTVEQQKTRSSGGLVSKREKIARSEEYLPKRPPWDYSPYRDGDEQPERSLPPIHHRSTYSLRSVHVSPAPKKRLTGSHSTLHTARSSSSITFSPYFDARHPHKPQKEELWWTPRD